MDIFIINECLIRTNKQEIKKIYLIGIKEGDNKNTLVEEKPSISSSYSATTIPPKSGLRCSRSVQIYCSTYGTHRVVKGKYTLKWRQMTCLWLRQLDTSLMICDKDIT